MNTCSPDSVGGTIAYSQEFSGLTEHERADLVNKLLACSDLHGEIMKLYERLGDKRMVTAHHEDSYFCHEEAEDLLRS